MKDAIQTNKGGGVILLPIVTVKLVNWGGNSSSNCYGETCQLGGVILLPIVTVNLVN